MSANPRGQRWYGRVTTANVPRVRIQLHSRHPGKSSGLLPEAIVRAAAAEYNRQGYDQSYERLQERGGLSDIEIIGLLADALGIEVPAGEADL